MFEPSVQARSRKMHNARIPTDARRPRRTRTFSRRIRDEAWARPPRRARVPSGTRRGALPPTAWRAHSRCPEPEPTQLPRRKSSQIVHDPPPASRSRTPPARADTDPRPSRGHTTTSRPRKAARGRSASTRSTKRMAAPQEHSLWCEYRASRAHTENSSASPGVSAARSGSGESRPASRSPRPGLAVRLSAPLACRLRQASTARRRTSLKEAAGELCNACGARESSQSWMDCRRRASMFCGGAGARTATSTGVESTRSAPFSAALALRAATRAWYRSRIRSATSLRSPRINAVSAPRGNSGLGSRSMPWASSVR